MLLLLLLSLITCDACPKDWDYLMLSLRWPVTLCQFTECTPVPKPIDFVIHGLWPTREPDIEPDHCDPSAPFDINKLEPLIPELSEHWPNLFPDTDAHQFWHHEWHDHGRCALEDEHFPDQVSYFRVSLELREKVNLLNRLQEAGVKPNNDTILKVEDVAQRLKDMLNARVQLYCLKHHHKDPFLFEIRICFKPDFTLMDCFDHTQCLTISSTTAGQEQCAVDRRNQLNSLLGTSQGAGYSAMPCPPGVVIFPSF